MFLVLVQVDRTCVIREQQVGPVVAVEVRGVTGVGPPGRQQVEEVDHAVRVHDRNLEQALYPVKAMLGFYIGGMGSRKRNFHKELMARMGFPEEADTIQRLFFEGKRDEAIAAVPDRFADEISLVGPKDRIKEKLKDWENSPVTTLLINGDATLLREMAELVL